MGNYCIKVKRGGFNYYTVYLERYFEKAAVNYGYHLVKRPEQGERYCLTFIGDPQMGGQKWITFTSDAISKAPYEKIRELSHVIAECFKSESIVEEIDEGLEQLIQMMKAYLKGASRFEMAEEQYRKYGMPHLWLFNREYSAFDEPPFITEGETKLRIDSHNTCEPGKSFLFEVQNYGGISKGLIINISFENSTDDVIELEQPTLILPNRKCSLHLQRLPLEMSRIVYRIELQDFNIPEGVNIYSAKLCGKKKQDEIDMRSFSLMFIPKGSRELLNSMEIEVMPIEYPANKAVLKVCE